MDRPSRKRIALIGTGHRGTGMWGINVVKSYSDYVAIVALCDHNKLRAERARGLIGIDAPIYTDVQEMLAAVTPETVIVCTRDSNHDETIVRALEAGADVITEKPMTTTAEKVRRILEAEKRTGRRVDVTFNYRYAPTARRIKELLASGIIGDVTSVDFHWFLDNKHGADYFRRWHAIEASSGSLFVHKSTHHFDLMNWYLGDEPEEVFAYGSLRRFGKVNPFRGERCRTCPHASYCDYYFDMSTDPWLEALYEDPSREDGYVRDACVFREEIDIPDTMSALIRYRGGVQVTYSVNTYMPIEGHFIAFDGTKGRIQIRQFERQPWETPDYDEIQVVRSFGGMEMVKVPHEAGGHFGGDPKLQDMLFKPGTPDPLNQRAGSRAGAMSVLCGVAALQSAKTGKPVNVPALLDPSQAIAA
jgi:predicted dehydrogenase